VTQTINNQNTSPLKRGRPGQRQQERLERIAARRRRRLQIAISIIAVALVVGAIAGLVLNQQHQDAVVAANNAHATEVVNTNNLHATATVNAANVQATATVNNLIKQNPSGPETPPAVTGTIHTTADGLQYIVLKEGTGPGAKPGQTVYTEYTGWFKSTNKKFDSSYDRGGQPLPLTLGQGQVIKGWDEGLTGMKFGETRRFIIPPSLAYGAQGYKDQQGHQLIPSNETLIFDTTVIGISDQPPPQQQQQ
jgi:FKBP-type peptidyl-prolyl cis-trans isomerase